LRPLRFDRGVTDPSKPHTDRRHTLVAAFVIVVAGISAYLNTLSVPFLLDDRASIVDNPTIHRLGSLTEVLSPPGGGLTVQGRPGLNLSLAINYAISGPRVWSYHVTNIAFHILGALTLFGIVGQTLRRRLRTDRGPSSTLIATAAALLWLLHPLQTESVTYVVQRAESLMALWFLLTLYGFIRATQSPRPRTWYFASTLSCVLGMATKEVMVGAPIVVFLYDVFFVTQDWGKAWRQRKAYYVSLAATWLLLGGLIVHAGNRGGSIGATAGITPWGYALSQTRAIVHYLLLSVWPHPLVFDYGSDFASAAAVWPYAFVVLAIVAVTIRSVWRRSAWGFLGAAFFVLLAPSSSFVGGTRQMMAEHRMYLPLALIVCGGAVTLAARFGRKGIWAAFVLAAGFGTATVARNSTYRSETAIWRDTVAKRPGNAWAQSNLGLARLADGDTAGARQNFITAIHLDPNLAEPKTNLGNVLVTEDRVEEAIELLREVVRVTPNDPDAHNNLGIALARVGRVDEATAEYHTAIELKPTHVEAHNNLANTLARAGHLEGAIAEYQQVLELRPNYAEAHNNWGNALLQAGRAEAAISQYQEATRLRADYAEAHYNLANAYAQVTELSRAIDEYGRALALRPNYASAHANLGNLLVRSGRAADALAHYQAVLQLTPADAGAHFNLANTWIRLGQFAEAEREVRQALSLRPDFAEAKSMAQWLQDQKKAKGL
jgi:protein O-mannosyl-transferase